MGQPLGAIVEVSFWGRLFEQRCLTILHYTVVTQSSETDPALEQNQLLNRIGTGDAQDLATPYLACCGTNFTLDVIRAQFVKPTRTRFTQTAVAAVGTRPDACTASNVSGVITKRTNLAGRSQIGAVHMPGVSEDSYSLGTIDSGYRTVMEAFAALITSSIGPTSTGGVYFPVIFHRNKVSAPFGDQVTEAEVQNTLRVMRRRTVGVGI